MTFDCIHAHSTDKPAIMLCDLGLFGGHPHVNMCNVCNKRCPKTTQKEKFEGVVIPNYNNEPWPRDLQSNIYYGVVEILTPYNKSIYCDKWTGRQLTKIELEDRKNQSWFGLSSERLNFTRSGMKMSLTCDGGNWVGIVDGVHYKFVSKVVAIQNAQSKGWILDDYTEDYNLWSSLGAMD